MLSIEGLGLRLGELRLECRSRSRRTAAWRWWGRRAPARPRCCGASPASLRPDARQHRAAGARPGRTGGADAVVPPEARRCGVRLPGLRALPPPERSWRNVAYPLRDGPAASGARRALELLDRFGLAAARGRPAAHALRRRAPARRPRPGARRSSRGRCCWTSRSRRSTRAPARTRRASWRAPIRRAAVPTVLVTHDFEEAAALADEIAVIDSGTDRPAGHAGRARGRGRRRRSSRISSASVVLTGRPRQRGGGRVPTIALDGGGTRRQHRRGLDRGRRGERPPLGDHARAGGLAGAELGPQPSRRAGRLGHASSAAACGSGLEVGGQALAAEVTPAAVAELGLRPGREVAARLESFGDPRRRALGVSMMNADEWLDGLRGRDRRRGAGRDDDGGAARPRRHGRARVGADRGPDRVLPGRPRRAAAGRAARGGGAESS